jgi:hypothetical protein
VCPSEKDHWCENPKAPVFGPYKMHKSESLLGALAKLREEILIFVLSVRFSVPPHGKLGSHWMDFHEILYLNIFQTSVHKIRVRINYLKNYGYFTGRPKYICDNISFSYSYNEKYADKFVENIKTHILCSASFSWKSCRLWDNVEIYCRAGQAAGDYTIRRMRIACWIPKATDTPRISYNYYFSTETIVRWKLFSVTCVIPVPASLTYRTIFGQTNPLAKWSLDGAPFQLSQEPELSPMRRCWFRWHTNPRIE